MVTKAAVLGSAGRLVIPLEIREALGIAEGDPLVLRLDDQLQLSITTPKRALARFQDYVAGLVPEGVSLADELIAERRSEAKREEA
jgi:AbrB family looped-hinge helix DNA binding protein